MEICSIQFPAHEELFHPISISDIYIPANKELFHPISISDIFISPHEELFHPIFISDISISPHEELFHQISISDISIPAHEELFCPVPAGLLLAKAGRTTLHPGALSPTLPVLFWHQARVRHGVDGQELLHRRDNAVCGSLSLLSGEVSSYLAFF